MNEGWTHPLTLTEVARGPIRVRLAPGPEIRAGLARRLALEGLPEFEADLRVRPWLDGAEISGSFRARVIQQCGVSLEPFEQALSGEVEVRLLPAGSKNAPEAVEPGGELTLDLDAPDPPDILEGDRFDLAQYAVEHLALEIDPFPRKPGAAFDYTPPEPEPSPFAVLRQLKDRKD